MGPKHGWAINDPPYFWGALSEEDKQAYRQLRKQIDPLTIRTTCEQSAPKFRIVLAKIQEYAIHHNQSDWVRCLVCGVAWLSFGCLAISTRQLCKLVHRCKSSINFCFQSLGYSTVAMSPAHAARLMYIFPFLRDDCAEMRQWTIRSTSEPQGHSPLVIPPGQLQLPDIRPPPLSAGPDAPGPAFPRLSLDGAGDPTDRPFPIPDLSALESLTCHGTRE
jgi:hypothetical protein